VSTRGGIGRCISRAATLLLRDDNPLPEIEIRGAGDAISRVCKIA